MNKELIQDQERKLCVLADHVFVLIFNLFFALSMDKAYYLSPNIVDLIISEGSVQSLLLYLLNSNLS